MECSGNCEQEDMFHLVAKLERVRASECEPAVPRAQECAEELEVEAGDEELLDEMLDGEVEEEEEEEEDTPPEVLRRSAAILLGLPGEQATLASASGGTSYRAAAWGPEEGEPWDRWRLRLSVDFSAPKSFPNAAATFRIIAQSLTQNAPLLPPPGFTRLPFGRGRIDLPDSVRFHRIAFAGPGGSLAAGTRPARMVPRDLGVWLTEIDRGEKAQIVEAHHSVALSNRTVERARVRIGDSNTDRRAALIHLEHVALLFETRVVSSASDGAPLDDATFARLVETLHPLFDLD